MREDLVAYALGELDLADRHRVEEALASDADLRAELAQIEECLCDNAAEGESTPGMPRGLADRTVQEVLACCDENEAGASPATRPDSCNFAGGLSLMSPVDMTVAIGMLLTVGSMLLPALYSNRGEAQRIACQNNLRQLYFVNELYAQDHGGFFPVVGPNEHAGIFATRLLETDSAPKEQLSQLLLCPGSPFAEQLAIERRTFSVPSRADLALAKGMWLLELKRTASGSYGYQVGYIKGDLYLPARRRNSRFIPLMADTPNVVANNRLGANHGGKFTNVLYQNGCVQSEPSAVEANRYDHLYMNSNGESAAGTCWNDRVVLDSGAQPTTSQGQQLPEPIQRRFMTHR